MATLKVQYAIPVTAVRIQGTVKTAVDSVLDKADTVPEVTVSLETVAGLRNQTLELPAGWIRDASATLGLTEDGRLSALSVESTGQLGKVVLGFAGVAAAVASTAVGATPAVFAAAAAARAATAGIDAPGPTPEELVAEEYEEKHEAEAKQREHYAALVTKTVNEIGELAEELAKPGAENQRWEKLRRLRFLEDLLLVLRAELALLNEHYKAWRASTLKTTTVEVDTRYTFDTLRTTNVTIDADGTPVFAEATEVKAAWERFGVLVTLDPDDAASLKVVAAATSKRKVTVRTPRPATVRFYERDGDKAVLVREAEQLVMDSYCEPDEVPLRRSWFGKRMLGLTFGDSGGLTGVSSSETSSLAAAAADAGGLPAAVAGGVENAVKIREQYAKLQDASLDKNLARAKKEVELKQQEITHAGLLATEADSAELERLKQQAAMIEQRKTTDPTDPVPTELDTLKKQLDTLNVRREVSVATRRLEAETELADLRLEIERLRAQWRRDNPGNGNEKHE